jgi:hypothetical protein
MSILTPRSVEQKLLAVVLITTLAALLVAIVAMVGYDLRLYHKSWIDDLTTQAELLGRTSGPALTFDDPRVAKENLELLRFRPEVHAAALYDARGRLFASYAQNSERAFPTLPEADGARVDGNELIIFKRVIDNREILGTVFLRANYDLYDRLLGYLGIAGVVALAAMLVAYGLSRPLVRSRRSAISRCARRGSPMTRWEGWPKPSTPCWRRSSAKSGNASAPSRRSCALTPSWKSA